jgi:hypothetical protein
MTPRLLIRVCALALAGVLGAGVGPGMAQMPDPSRMSGVPLPVADVPVGTVTVRVIRGSFANPVSSLTVEIVGAGAPQRATTNDIGRAEFSGLAPGTRVKATALVAGERLESQEFAVPAAGGIRLILVAADPSGQRASPAPAQPGAAAPPALPAQPGQVVLGDESRFVFEMGEDGLSVFYVLQLLNASASPVQPEGPIVFELPEDARGATVLQGSSPQGVAAGRRLTISGPFAPGPTIVQLAYTMPYAGKSLVIEQRLPIALTHVAVVAQKIGDLQLASPQFAEQRTMPAQGNLYIAARGGAVAAGSVLRFDFSGMPAHSTWPRNAAIGLALFILAGGAWGALRAGSGRAAEAAERQRLEARRDGLFDELAALDARQHAQEIDPVLYAERRRELVAALEGIYIALDDEVAVSRAS